MGIDTNESEVLGIGDQTGEAFWTAFIWKWGIMDEVLNRWVIMDTVYLLGEALGIDTNESEVLGIGDQTGEAFWMAFICRWGIMDEVLARWGITDPVFLLGEAVGMDTNMGKVLEIGDEWWGILDGIYL